MTKCKSCKMAFCIVDIDGHYNELYGVNSSPKYLVVLVLSGLYIEWS